MISLCLTSLMIQKLKDYEYIFMTVLNPEFYLVSHSLMAQTVKNPPAMRETQVQFLGWEDPTEKGMETHSSILAWRIPWTEEPDGPLSMRSQIVEHDRLTNF